MNHGSLASESFRLLSAFVYHILSDREVVDGVRLQALSHTCEI